MDAKPETIFKYEPFSLRAVQNVKCHSVYFNSPSWFNDPFDCGLKPRIRDPSDVEVDAISAKMLSDATTPDKVRQLLVGLPKSQVKAQLISSAERIIEEQRDDFNNTKGVTCFSQCNDNMLMWSHYGGQHKGFCLEFDTTFEPLTKLRRVNYSADIPVVDITRFMLHDDYEHLIDLFCTKSIDWAYEREWRVLHADKGTVFTYEPNALRAIYFGAKMTKQDIDMICLVLYCQNPDVELFQGERSDSEFRIEFSSLGRASAYKPYAEAKRLGLE
ncbi:DUF2971 domain-containing protein [Novipirellula caenicola]|uniref:DUF2971 domain-containing protein n=1 Tax=Novipirellula caenicola TaxID=1536901 RepID=A0ABP9W415_9BACT